MVAKRSLLNALEFAVLCCCQSSMIALPQDISCEIFLSNHLIHHTVRIAKLSPTDTDCDMRTQMRTVCIRISNYNEI